jgi:hypothetical protein
MDRYILSAYGSLLIYEKAHDIYDTLIAFIICKNKQMVGLVEALGNESTAQKFLV